MPEMLSFISANWLLPLWNKLIEIRSKREQQLSEISDNFEDPFAIAHFYVEPKCQHHNPADYNEVEPISFVRCPVFDTVNDFLNREFLVSDGRNQMFILGDAGMGKTSLFLMLKLAHLTSFWPKKYNCELLKLETDTIARIEQLSDKRNTILLLDALDEDPLGFGRVEERLIELLTATRHFRRVIISCRTQYFPSGDDDPFDRPGRIEVGGFVCPMIFLSLFDDYQVEEYLHKRFSKGETEKLTRSRSVIEKMESLRFRPLLLAHIEDIIDSPEHAWNEYSIYRALVLTWLLREEVRFRGLKGKPVNAAALWAACTGIAFFMQENGKRFVTPDELKTLIRSIPEVKHLKHFDIGGRSLLNLNSKGEYRFSHYTTQEFLIAHAIVLKKIDGSEMGIRMTDQIINFLAASPAAPLHLNFCNFSGCDLTRLNLAQAEALRAVFTKANLRGMDLTEANLSEADLSQADLSGAKLLGARLIGARGEGADLSGSILSGADLSNADFTGSVFNNCSLYRTVFRGAKLDGASFVGQSLEQVDFSGASLKRCNLRKHVLTTTTFEKADLEGADLSESDISNVNLLGANLSHANLTKASLTGAILKHARIDGAILDGVDFGRVDLQGVDLKHVNLGSAIIERSTIQALIVAGVSLSGCKLNKYDLRYANLSRVNMRDANFTGVDLYGAVLYQADLSGADMRDAQLEGADLRGAYYSRDTKLPDMFFPYNEGMLLRERSVSRRNIRDQA